MNKKLLNVLCVAVKARDMGTIGIASESLYMAEVVAVLNFCKRFVDLLIGWNAQCT